MKRLCVLPAMLSLALMASIAQANLLDDGSFELATHDSTTSNSAWVMTANVPNGMAGEDSARFSTSAWAAGDGETGVWFQSFRGDPENPDDPARDRAQADVTQTVIAPSSGDYDLRFLAARETNVLGGSFPVTLSSSGTGGSVSVDLLTATFNDGGNMNSNPTSFLLSLTGVTAGDTLTVTAAMIDGQDAGANPQSLMLDKFNLQVPEPTSLLLAGLGWIGVMGLRRQR